MRAFRCEPLLVPRGRRACTLGRHDRVVPGEQGAEHLGRLGGAAASDPPLALSSAKSFIEATFKLVLEELGEATTTAPTSLCWPGRSRGGSRRDWRRVDERRQLRRGELHSADDLRHLIGSFINAYNRRATSFLWVYKTARRWPGHSRWLTAETTGQLAAAYLEPDCNVT